MDDKVAEARGHRPRVADPPARLDLADLPGPSFFMRMARQITLRAPRGRYRLSHELGQLPVRRFRGWFPIAAGRASFFCDLRDSIAREVWFTGRYEPQEAALIETVLQAGMTFVDAGANWGYFSLLAAARVGSGGRILSFEPDPRLAVLLRANLRALGVEAAVCEIALADAHGELRLAGFAASQDNHGTSRLVGANAAGGTAGTDCFPVRAEALDDVLDRLQVGQVDLVKMDIEGGEALALEGMRLGLAAGRYRRLLLEVHPGLLADHGSSVREVIQPLQAAGYHAWRIDHSLAATRQAAYRRDFSLREALRPFSPDDAWDAWPHLLWLAPGVSLEVASGR